MQSGWVELSILKLILFLAPWSKIVVQPRPPEVHRPPAVQLCAATASQAPHRPTQCASAMMTAHTPHHLDANIAGRSRPP